MKSYCKTKGQECDCKESFKNKSLTTKSHESSNKEGTGFNFLENLHLVGGAVSQNICKEGDTSWYCRLSRAYSAVFMIIALLVILFVVVYLFRTFVVPLLGFGKKFRSKSSSRRK
jgi:hypothetical protein